MHINFCHRMLPLTAAAVSSLCEDSFSSDCCVLFIDLELATHDDVCVCKYTEAGATAVPTTSTILPIFCADQF
jgi:hypothetical protein